jgi:hypothetical protein
LNLPRVERSVSSRCGLLQFLVKFASYVRELALSARDNGPRLPLGSEFANFALAHGGEDFAVTTLDNLCVSHMVFKVLENGCFRTRC